MKYSPLLSRSLQANSCSLAACLSVRVVKLQLDKICLSYFKDYNGPEMCIYCNINELSLVVVRILVLTKSLFILLALSHTYGGSFGSLQSNSDFDVLPARQVWCLSLLYLVDSLWPVSNVLQILIKFPAYLNFLPDTLFGKWK